MSKISSFWSIKNKDGVYRNRDCQKKIFWESLREHAMKIINFKIKNEVVNKREAGIIWKCKTMLYLQWELERYLKDKKYCKVRDRCHYAGEYRGAAHSICNLANLNVSNIYVK